MGNPRNWFRPDQMIERGLIKLWPGSSDSNQCMKKEHNRRQRQADRLHARRCVVNEPFDSSEGPDLEVMEGEENGKIDGRRIKAADGTDGERPD